MVLYEAQLAAAAGLGVARATVAAVAMVAGVRTAAVEARVRTVLSVAGPVGERVAREMAIVARLVIATKAKAAAAVRAAAAVAVGSEAVGWSLVALWKVVPGDPRAAGLGFHSCPRWRPIWLALHDSLQPTRAAAASSAASPPVPSPQVPSLSI